MIDPRSLEIIDGAVFNSEVCPIFDEDKAKSMGLAPVEQEALDITKKTKEKLLSSPPIEVVWPDFVNFVNTYKPIGNKSSWGAPISAGFNIDNFDNKITARLCEKYGPFDKKYGCQSLFHPVHSIDVIRDCFRWTDNVKINSNNSISMDSIRDWLGMTKDGAHDALNDVIDTAELLRRFMLRYRDMYKKTHFAGALAEWKRPDIRSKK